MASSTTLPGAQIDDDLAPRCTFREALGGWEAALINPTGRWAAEHLPVLEEYYAAIEQLSLEAGASGDSVKETGSLAGSAPALDAARVRMARAAAALRRCPLPPDAVSAQHLDAALTAMGRFSSAERFEDWVEAWRQAMKHNDAFVRAFASADGQSPPSSFS